MVYRRPTGWLDICRWMVLLVGGCCCGTAAAHPFHTSVAELEYNSQTKRIEVSLKLPAADLERALSSLAKRRINLDKDPLAELVTQYLDRHFLLVDSSLVPHTGHAELLAAKWPSEQRSQARFVGHELMATWSWLYFEIELPAGVVEEMSLIDTVLFDINSGQINTVSVRRGSQRFALKMTEKDAWARLDPAWLQEKDAIGLQRPRATTER